VRLADKAKAALGLCQQLSASQALEGKQVYIEQLNELWPDIRCRLNPEGRLCVYVLAERVQRVPKSLGFHAHYIEEVRKNGTARVVKNKLGHGPRIGHILPEPTIELGAFDATFDLTEPLSAWERIMGDDDF